MTRINGTQSSFIDQKIDDKVENIRIGRVQQVFEHSSTDDQSNFEVDVKILGEDVQHRAIPHQQESNDEISVPTVGDKVIVEYRQGAKTQPIARNAVYTNEDRPPLGKAGMSRKRITSDDSPAGPGDLFVESYTDYDVNPAQTNPDNAQSINEAWVRIAKKADDSDADDLPVSIEIRESPKDDSAEVKMSINSVDGHESNPTWGIKFDLKTGEFKILDAGGYGIVSDGYGNFTWHHESINESNGTSDSL